MWPAPANAGGSQGQGPVLDDALHDEGGAQTLNAGEGGDAVIIELLEGPQVAGDYVQEVVGVTEKPLGLQNVGDRGDGLFKGLDGLAAGLAHRDEDESVESQAQCVGVKLCPVTADRTGLLQRA